MSVTQYFLVFGLLMATPVAGASAAVIEEPRLKVSFTTAQFIKGYFPCGGVQKPLTCSKETTPGLWHMTQLLIQEEPKDLLDILKTVKELFSTVDSFSTECKTACPGITDGSVRFEKAYQAILSDINKLIESL